MRTRSLFVVLVGAVCAAALALPGVAAAGFGPLGSFSGFGAGAGQSEATGGLTGRPDGKIYQADYGENRVNVFSAQGTFLFAFGAEVNPAGGDVCTAQTGCQNGLATSGAGGLNNPEDVALDAFGHIFVADTNNSRIG